MKPESTSSGKRSNRRRQLYLLVAGLAAATACLLVEPMAIGADAAPSAGVSPGAPPECAIRPNAPTEPIMGNRVAAPGG
ncbi:MAG: hypothetical protein ACK5VI_08800 [Opitutia bacterium]|jgi:hypothetical protein